MRVYLSGAITGNPEAAEQFRRKQERLEALGFEVFNPLSLGKGHSYPEYMRKDIQELLQCDYICYVNSTSSSCGVLAEKTVAHVCEIPELTSNMEATVLSENEVEGWR